MEHNNVGGEKKRALRSKKKDTDTEDTGCGNEAMLAETVSFASIHDAINKTMAKATSELKNDISKQLSDFQCNFQEDIEKQLGDMRADIIQQMEETAGKLEASSQRLDEAVQCVEEA